MLLADARSQFAKGATGTQVQAMVQGHLQMKVSPGGRAKSEKKLQVVSDVQDYEFQLFGASLPLHNRLVSLSFDDTEAVLRGSLTIQSQTFRDEPFMREGALVELRYRPLGSQASFTPWWRMRTVKPAVTYQSGEDTYTLASDLDRLNSSKDDFQYKQSKKKKYWLAKEIIEDICQKFRIRSCVIQTKHHFLEMVREGMSPLDVINEVLDTERSTTGLRYAVWFDTLAGILYVQPRTRQAALYKLANACIEAQIQVYLHERFATALTLRGPKFKNDGLDVTEHARTNTGKNTAHGTADGAPSAAAAAAGEAFGQGIF